MTSKKPRKRRYNPAKNSHRIMRKHAARCVAFRWDNSKEHSLALHASGPYGEDKNLTLLDWAFNQSERWMIVAHACFVTLVDEEYYEEMATVGPIGPMKIVNSKVMLNDLFTQLMDTAKKGGNEYHYVGGVIALMLYTPEMAKNLEKDSWIKRQAAYRYKEIMKDLPKLRAEQEAKRNKQYE